MKEQLYTIPVNDAFDADCECPLCAMRQSLEADAIAYTMGPSYMEDDNRAMTDEAGFCVQHIQKLYREKNRLGLALMLNTHMDKVIKDLKACADKTPAANKLFKKDSSASPVGAYVEKLEHSCFICNRINGTFERYVDTIFQLWKKDAEFREKVKQSKGFCVKHYGYLYEMGRKNLNQTQYEEFTDCINRIFFDNLERVNEDVAWFINKFDYRYQNEPWKNAKDALPRAVTKTHSVIPEE